MPKAASSRRRKPSRAKKGSSFWLDKLIAGFSIFLSLILLIVAVALMVSLAFRQEVMNNHSVKTALVSISFGFLGLFLVAIAVLNLVAYVGMFRGRRWAFFLVGALQILGLVQIRHHTVGSTAESGSFWLLLYVILRLIPVFGPKPK